MLMPFGKYEGWRIDDIPFSYLVWLKNCVSLRELLRSHEQRTNMVMLAGVLPVGRKPQQGVREL
jgi:hypothetical protein